MLEPSAIMTHPDQISWALADRVRLGRWMSYALRYGIYRSYIPVDLLGWVPVEMLTAWGRHTGRRGLMGNPLCATDVFHIVTTDDQGRFALEWRPHEAAWYVRATPPPHEEDYYYSQAHSEGHATAVAWPQMFWWQNNEHWNGDPVWDVPVPPPPSDDVSESAWGDILVNSPS